MKIRRAVPGDAAALAHVHVERWQTTYAGIVPAEFLASLSVEARETWWQQVLEREDTVSAIFVAEDEAGTLVGFAYGGRETRGDPVYRGELYAIYLLQAAQRRGGGRMLVQAVAGALAAAGISSMLVWVLAENPSRQFYETLGAQYLRATAMVIGGATLEAVAYGWPNLEALMRPAG